ncbi:LuxR C-terminal-related transcriptional regulator [Ruminococcaceae bacterium OttesenSCG-928-A11]|nr:LuxR C-terminal-related transcriptional regulator [Ruminococcaceae bacterium OttesenSCG-928-A11]
MFESRFFALYTEAQRKTLVKLSLLNTFTGDLAEKLYKGAPADLDALETHVFITAEPTTGQFYFHHLYKTFLQKKAALLEPEEAQQVWQLAAEYYAAQGNTIDAVACYRKSGDHAGMIGAISDFVRTLHGISAEDAAYILEHIDLLSPEETRQYPIADYLRALIHTNTLELDEAEALLLNLEKRLLEDPSAEARALLGESYAILGNIQMMRPSESFGAYYEKAVACLPNSTTLRNRGTLTTLNNHNFSMADNRPGARERMEQAAHYGIPLISRVTGGSMRGGEHLFSAEAAYLSWQLDDARQHAWRVIYAADPDAQHDLVCNAHCLLARVALLQGDYAEMTKQVQTVDGFAAKYNIGALKEIRDTALGWYYTKLRDPQRVPKSISMLDNTGRQVLAYDRSQVVHANYLIVTGDFPRLVGLLEHARGLFLTGGIWPDHICRHIMLAIGYHHLGKPREAVEALWTAYDMAYANGLTTLFIEGEEQMVALIGDVRGQNERVFDPEWLDFVEREAADFSKRAAAVRAAHRKQNLSKTAQDSPLTKREMEILQALSMGLTREEIASDHYISVNTVKSFIRSIYTKLDAANRAEAVSIAITHGYINISSPE